MSSNKYLLAIPIFNEAASVTRVLAWARVHVPDILVVDDGSTDGTSDLLAREHGLHVIEHAENRGYGQSLAKAFAFAARQGYEWLITMDCDEQHEPALISRFVAATDRNNADIISGSRYLQVFPGSDTPPADRRAINRVVTALLNARLGLGITDAFCGFKAYRVAALVHFRVSVSGYAMPLQLWVQAARAGLRIVELPVPLVYRAPLRRFGGRLDDPRARFEYYLQTLEQEMAARPTEAVDLIVHGDPQCSVTPCG